MREILFKKFYEDKNEEDKIFINETWINGKWVYGGVWDNARGQRFITEKIGCSGFSVIPETVGQFTGLSDKNNVKIFEGDIAKQDDEIGKIQYESNYCLFAIILKRNSDLCQYINDYYCEILGNIYSNPKLLTK